MAELNYEAVVGEWEERFSGEDWLLDDMVHQCKSLEATTINNGGTADQIDYLIGFYGIDMAVTLLRGVGQELERG